MALELITAPTEEPITRAEAKAHLRIDTAQAEIAPYESLQYGAYAAPSNGTGLLITGYKCTAIVQIETIAAGDDVTCKIQHSDDNVTYTNVHTADTWTNISNVSETTDVFDDDDSGATFRQVYDGNKPYVRVAITAVTDGGTLQAWLALQTLTTDENDLIDGLITAARKTAENYLDRAFCTQVWDWKYDEIPTAWTDSRFKIKAPLPPLQSVAARYRETLGSTTYSTIGSTVFSVSLNSKIKSHIQLAYNQTWPDVPEQSDAFVLRLTCGYGAASAVPSAIKAAIKLMVGMLFMDRAAGGDKLLTPRIRDLLDTERHNL